MSRRQQDFAAGAAAMLAAWPEAAVLLDPQARVIALNPVARALLGPALQSAPGDQAMAWFPPTEQEGFRAALSQGGRLRLSLVDPLAAPRPVEVELRPMPPGMLLLRMTPPAQPGREERLALVGRMAGGIAHDFNNLLGIILGASAAAGQAADAQGRACELAVLDAAAERGAGLVRQLLAFARQQVLAPRVLALNTQVAAMAELLPRLLGRAVRLEVVLEEPGRMVLADPSQLDQVILNLAVNARDAIRDSGRGGVIRLATGRRVVLRPSGEGPGGIPPGRYASISVEDDGPGIPAEVLARIFEPFFSTKIDQGGTGLGLATVQGIVAQSGGHVLAESPPGGGSRFTILLPRHEGAALPMAPPTAPPMLVGACHATILLAEDEPALLRLCAQSLEQAGHTVLRAEDGYTATEALEAGAAPDLLVTDVSMPGMDGVALARAAQGLRPGLRVLLLSGYAAATLKVDLAAEGWHFLAKPCGPDALRAAVAGALAKSAV